MKTLTRIPLIFVLGLLAFPLLSCGSNGAASSGTIINPSPVQAQSTYSSVRDSMGTSSMFSALQSRLESKSHPTAGNHPG